MKYDQYLQWRGRVQNMISAKIDEMRPRPSDYVQVLGNAIGIDPPETPEEEQQNDPWLWVMFYKVNSIITTFDNEGNSSIDSSGFGPWLIMAVVPVMQNAEYTSATNAGPDDRDFTLSETGAGSEAYELVLTSRVMRQSYLTFNTFVGYQPNYIQGIENMIRDPSLGSGPRNVVFEIVKADLSASAGFRQTLVNRGLSTLSLTPPGEGSFVAYLYQILLS